MTSVYRYLIVGAIVYSNTSLSIAVTAGEPIVLVVSAVSTGNITEVLGYYSGGIAIA